MTSSKMKYLKIISLLLLPHGILQAQLHVQNNAIFWVGQEVTVSVGGDVSNDGSLENGGTITFTGDWNNTNTYIDDGTIEAIGSVPQTIANLDQNIATLIVNGMDITLEGNTVLITEELAMTNGNVQLGANTVLIIADTASITGGSPDAFIIGTVIQRGTGPKFYPIGIDDRYMPLDLLDVSGTSDIEMAISLGLFNGIEPFAGRHAIGVSDYHFWQLETLVGTFNGSPVKGTFQNADLRLASIPIENTSFRWAKSINAILESPNLEGPYTDLDIEFSSDPDETTFGTIITSDTVTQQFLAVGLQADVPEGGVLFVPTAFSPRAMLDDDQRLKVFAQLMNTDDFKFSVFNAFGVEVYKADYLEATTNGWDGNHKGKEQPSGSYRFFVKFVDDNDNPRRQSGTVLLIR